MTIREQILQVLFSFPDVRFSKNDVEEIERRVERANTEKHEKRLGFAYVVARNWAIDQVRRKEAATRMRALAEKMEAAEQARRNAEAEWRAAMAEFWPTAFIVFGGRHKIGRVYDHVLVLWLVLYGMSYEEIRQSHYPTESFDTLRQWKNRGRLALCKIGSPRLQRALNERR